MLDLVLEQIYIQGVTSQISEQEAGSCVMVTIAGQIPKIESA